MGFTEEVYDGASRKSPRWPFQPYDGIRRFGLLQFEETGYRYCLLSPLIPIISLPLTRLLNQALQIKATS
jgi:hypothetical protein